jgi:HK97 family phage portal protein
VTVLAAAGDQLVTVSGLPAGLKRSSQPLSAFYGGGLVSMVGDGQAVSYTQLYRTQPWVASMVNKLERQISRLPLKVYEKDSQNAHRRVVEHPLADLLSRPFPRGGPTHLKQHIALPMLIHGNGLVMKVRDTAGAPPSKLLPVDWRFVTPHGLAGMQGDFIPGEVEFWEINYPQERAFVAPDEMLHFKWVAPDSALGVSPLQQLGVTLQSEDAAQRYTAASYRNGARPSGALVFPGMVSRPDRDAIRNEVQSLHGGVDKAFNIAVVSGGADWKPFSQSAQEAQLIETRKLNREEIAAVYDIPPPMVGILDQATYSNITEQHRMLYVTILGPWLTMIEETIKAQLIDPEPAWDGLFVEFDISEQLKGDPLQRARAEALFITHGVYTINEARKLENLPPIDNPICAMPLIPVNNMAPATSLNPQLEQPIDSDPVDPEAVPGVDDAPQTPVLASHIARAGDRVVRKTAAGSADVWDRDRFERELASDLSAAGLDPQVAERAADGWAGALTAVVADADGDVTRLRASLRALAGAVGTGGLRAPIAA